VPNRAAARARPSDATTARESSALSVAAIVAAGIRLADKGGLDSVSIRRIARELGTRPMSLYTHIASKDELLDLMADELVGRVADEPAREDHWREAVSASARRLHQGFIEHPWLVAAFRDRRQPGPNTARYAQQLLTAVAPLDLPPQTAWTLLGIVNDYTLGHALRVVTAGHARTLENAADATPDLDALTAVNDRRATAEDFELGLATVLDGIHTRFLAPIRRR